ncbi:MAG: FAD/NAD(P)-binding protein [Thermoplasmata archaeon]
MPFDAGTTTVERVPSVHPWAPVPFTVKERKGETGDTITLTLSPTEGSTSLSFRPGQFNMLYAFGVGEVAISLSGDAESPHRYVHTIRGVGNVSRALCDAEVGEVVGVRGPYGKGWPLAEAQGRDIVLVAGGLGLPPLRPVLYELLRHPAHYGRVEVIYGARSPKDLVYYDEVQEWRTRPNIRFQTTVDTAGEGWKGDVGVVTTRLPDAHFAPDRTVAFLCGPEIMMKITARALIGRGVPSESIWLSLERNMKCAVGICGHCQFGPEFVCRDGPVFRYREIEPFLAVREI